MAQTTEALTTLDHAHDAASLAANIDDRNPYTDWEGVPLHRAVFSGDNTVEVIAGTSAPKTEDARTVVMIHDLHRTCIESIRSMLLDPEDPNSTCGVILMFKGASEARTMADAFEFAAQVIRRQLSKNHGGVA